jgi:hypothetical protein
VKIPTVRALRAAAVVLLGIAVAGAPVLTYAQHGFGGGGGHVGGGHFGGGGHVSSGHFAGGGHAFAAPHYAAAGHYAGFAGHYTGFAGHGYAAPHYGAGAHFAAAGAGHYGLGGAGHYGLGGAGHAGWTGRYGAGWYGGHYWGGAHFWGGGYWHGVFWPHIWFNPGWAWFLPVLPLGYATFWWGGVPYYYSNDLYYSWSPAYNGYVVSDPPPAATGDDSAQNSGDAGGVQYAQPQPGEPAPYNGGAAAPSGAGVGDVYLYPRNGQSDAQTQNDRYECHSWAVNQTGFDPTRSSQQASGSSGDYRRAMIACLDARGYSAR